MNAIHVGRIISIVAPQHGLCFYSVRLGAESYSKVQNACEIEILPVAVIEDELDVILLSSSDTTHFRSCVGMAWRSVAFPRCISSGSQIV